MIRKATATSRQITRLAFYTINGRPSLPVIRQLINAVLIPKLAYGLTVHQPVPTHLIHSCYNSSVFSSFHFAVHLGFHTMHIMTPSSLNHVCYPFHIFICTIHCCLHGDTSNKRQTDDEKNKRFKHIFQPVHILIFSPTFPLLFIITLQCAVALLYLHTLPHLHRSLMPHHDNYGTLCSTCSIT